MEITLNGSNKWHSSQLDCSNHMYSTNNVFADVDFKTPQVNNWKTNCRLKDYFQLFWGETSTEK
jgi:hypothetical protein